MVLTDLQKANNWVFFPASHYGNKTMKYESYSQHHPLYTLHSAYAVN